MFIYVLCNGHVGMDYGHVGSRFWEEIASKDFEAFQRSHRRSNSPNSGWKGRGQVG